MFRPQAVCLSVYLPACPLMEYLHAYKTFDTKIGRIRGEGLGTVVIAANIKAHTSDSPDQNCTLTKYIQTYKWLDTELKPGWVTGCGQINK